MDWFIWFIVTMITIFVLSGITIGIIIIFKLRVRKNVKGIIFLKAGGQTSFWINRKQSATTTVNNCNYNFNEKAVRKTPWKDFIYYLEGYSEPIIPDFDNKKLGLSPEELKIILKNDLMEKLYGSKDIKTLKLLILINLFTGIISLLCLLFLLSGGVKVKDTPELRALIYNATRSAIMGL